MDLLECIHKRRAIRKFLAKPVEKEKLGILLDAGRMAPSSGNLQNWKFIIVKDPNLRKRVAEACYDQHWIAKAPVLLIVGAEINKIRRFYGVRGERLFAIQNCALASQNIMLAATALGLGSNFVSSFDDELMSNIFGVPENSRIQAVIPIGYTDENPNVPVRYPVDTLTYFNVWGRNWEDIDHVLREYGSKHRRFIEDNFSKTKEVREKLEKESKSIFSKIKKKLKEKHGKL